MLLRVLPIVCILFCACRARDSLVSLLVVAEIKISENKM